MDKLFVSFGLEILKKVPGRVSTEVDARSVQTCHKRLIMMGNLHIDWGYKDKIITLIFLTKYLYRYCNNILGMTVKIFTQ